MPFASLLHQTRTPTPYFLLSVYYWLGLAFPNVGVRMLKPWGKQLRWTIRAAIVGIGQILWMLITSWKYFQDVPASAPWPIRRLLAVHARLGSYRNMDLLVSQDNLSP